MPKLKIASRSVTMRDVAKAAGVSQSTVSRVLSQTVSDIAISDETYDRVHEAVRMLGYYPNLTARSLRTQRSHMIAIMIADISNPFYHFITRTVQDIAVHHNYDVLISNTDHIHEYEKRFCETMMHRPVDGIILVPYHLTDDDIARLLHHTGAAITVLGSHIQHPGVDVISADDETATYDAVRWLIEEKKHRRIGFIGASPHFPVSTRRERGYRRALHEAGLPLDAALIQEGDWTHASGYRAMQTLLSNEARPSAVFACNDTMAIGGLNAALDHGMHVPSDVAIVGFDNVPTASLVRPALTTVAQYPVEIGKQLAQALFERIEGNYTGEQRRFDVPLRLIVRQST